MNNYILSPNSYITQKTIKEAIDIKALNAEIKQIQNKKIREWRKLDSFIDNVFEESMSIEEWEEKYEHHQ